jgi:hypothetical protein
MRTLLAAALTLLLVALRPCHAEAGRLDPKVKAAVGRALDWLAREQRRQGYWEANQMQYRVAMTALAGNAMLCEGSTTTRGKYAKNVRMAVDYLLDLAEPPGVQNPNGLIGYKNDFHYTYGHGFSMLFLSQVFGEEEDAERREQLRRVLTRAVTFCGQAQTSAGGWGYVSAKDGGDFDEGSTCVTQVQGLRACRNAGITVPKEVIDRAVEYIKKCTTPEGGVQYSIKGGGSRPPITAAAVACLFNSGDYDSDYVKKLLNYCKHNLSPSGDDARSFGHWHYSHYYYAQVMYRMGGDEWKNYSRAISQNILRRQSADGSWKDSQVGPVYTTAINTTILQLENGYLPIYQR